jgi:hypothetical protein
MRCPTPAARRPRAADRRAATPRRDRAAAAHEVAERVLEAPRRVARAVDQRPRDAADVVGVDVGLGREHERRLEVVERRHHARAVQPEDGRGRPALEVDEDALDAARAPASCARRAISGRSSGSTPTRASTDSSPLDASVPSSTSA